MLGPDLDEFLNDVSGVIHVGANMGQERMQYADHGLNVLWIEPIPQVFEKLEKNVRSFAKQRAIRALITDRKDAEYPFHIASNEGASSSIFEFKDHSEVWPEITREQSMTLRSTTLTDLIHEENVDLRLYDGLVLDTQGSELLVLKGAEAILHHFRYVKLEVADFEAYAGCCQLDEVNTFMFARGYVIHARVPFAEHSAGGSYYDVVYRRS